MNVEPNSATISGGALGPRRGAALHDVAAVPRHEPSPTNRHTPGHRYPATPHPTSTMPLPTEHDELNELLADVPTPAVLVDLDVFDANLEALRDVRRRPVRLRVSGKSLRAPWLIERALARLGPDAGGVMARDANEAARLAGVGVRDLLMGYPCTSLAEAETLASLVADGVKVVAMVDDLRQVDWHEQAARQAGVVMPVCVDVDASLRLAGGLVHLGVRRSPLRPGATLGPFLAALRGLAHIRPVGLMMYEAQVAGVPDLGVGALRGVAVRSIKRASLRQLVTLRAAAVAEFRAAGFELELVNGGGSGSVAATSAATEVTEVTIGSGLLGPALFDGFRARVWQPASFVVLAVSRIPGDGWATLHGGGWLASGTAGPDRAPVLWSPPGWQPTSMEGWGEVQTPLRAGLGAPLLRPGDRVLARYAKAGEVMERVDRFWTFSEAGGLRWHPSR